MPLPAAMQTALRSVITILGESWSYASLTSAYDAETPAYSAYTAFTAQRVQQNIGDEFDQLKGSTVKKERVVLKCSDAIALKVGDLVKDATAVVYHVDGLDDAATSDGLVRYRASRMAGQLGQANRGGGI